MENLYVGIDVFFLGYPLPQNVKGFLIEDQGQYLIYINDRVSIEEQKTTIKHEITHLTRNHINEEDDVKNIETRRML